MSKSISGLGSTRGASPPLVGGFGLPVGSLGAAVVPRVGSKSASWLWATLVQKSIAVRKAIASFMAKPPGCPPSFVRLAMRCQIARRSRHDKVA